MTFSGEEIVMIKVSEYGFLPKCVYYPCKAVQTKLGRGGGAIHPSHFLYFGEYIWTKSAV